MNASAPATSLVGPTGTRRRRRIEEGPFLALVFVLPGLLLLLGILWPFTQGVWWAFSIFQLTRPGEAAFNGGANIARVLTPGTPEFQALLTTLRLAVVCVCLQTVLGFGVALLLTWPAGWTRLFRLLVVLPMLVPPIAATIIWKVMLVDRGLVNFALTSLGLPGVNWFGSPVMAFWAIVLVDTWIYTPFAILILLAGLQSIPRELYEAARVDGASLWMRIRNVDLPLSRPFLVLVAVFRGVDSLKMFDVIWSSTKGGPLRSTTNLNVLAYEQGVTYLNYGRSMAILFVLWLLCYGLAVLLLRQRRRIAA